MSDSLWPHELQHARPPCPSPTPGVHSDSRPSSQWCHSAISSSVVPFSFCLQFLPALEAFPMSQVFAWGGQSTRVSASASFPLKKSQGWSPSEWTGCISLQSKGLSGLSEHHEKVSPRLAKQKCIKVARNKEEKQEKSLAAIQWEWLWFGCVSAGTSLHPHSWPAPACACLKLAPSAVPCQAGPLLQYACWEWVDWQPQESTPRASSPQLHVSLDWVL